MQLLVELSRCCGEIGIHGDVGIQACHTLTSGVALMSGVCKTLMTLTS